MDWKKVFLNETKQTTDTIIVKSDGVYLIVYQGQIVNNVGLPIEMGTQLHINFVKCKCPTTNITKEQHYGVPTIITIEKLKKGDRLDIVHFVDRTASDIPKDGAFLIMDDIKHTFKIRKLN